jgi:hypothetical protein
MDDFANAWPVNGPQAWPAFVAGRASRINLRNCVVLPHPTSLL